MSALDEVYGLLADTTQGAGEREEDACAVCGPDEHRLGEPRVIDPERFCAEAPDALLWCVDEIERLRARIWRLEELRR